MSNLSIIKDLIEQGHKGTYDLYSKIPYFLRTRLDSAISKYQWARVSEGCELKDQRSLSDAKHMYDSLLQYTDECINDFKKNPEVEDATLLIVDKYNLKKEFKDDAPRFVTEMAKCLKMETEMIFTYKETVPSDSDMAECADNTNQMDNSDLEDLELLLQGINSELEKARKSIDECNKYYQLLSDSGNIADIECSPEMADFMFTEPNQFTVSKQRILEALKLLNKKCLDYTEKLNSELKSWKLAEAKASVKVGPDADPKSLTEKYSRFGKVVSSVVDWFAPNGNLQIIRKFESNAGTMTREFCIEVGRVEIDFHRYLKSCIEIVVVSQPKGVIGIENKGRKDFPNYCTKKTQAFSTTARVLFLTDFQCTATVKLFAEKDFAEVTGTNGQSCLRVKQKHNLPDIKFEIEVTNFSRLEVNNVYKQFFRLVYDFEVSAYGNNYTLQTMSLPITFNTGANQILEHEGSRFWYCASVPDLYKKEFKCPDPLPVDQVISMLDDRVSCLSTNGRRLDEEEKRFLSSRLPSGSDGMVTMQGFLKDKMKSLRKEEVLSYSFYTWFYAVINSIKQLLLKAWQDGIIYGFLSDKVAEEILMKPENPEGTFLLRPSISEIKKTSSADATAALTMEVKMRNEDAYPFDGHQKEFQVRSIPLLYKYIEKNTLEEAIKSIAFNDKSVAKFLYSRVGGSSLGILKSYGKEKKRLSFPDYNIIVEKTEKLNIKTMPSATASAEGVEPSNGENDSGRDHHHQRKRRYRQEQSFSSLSPLMSEMGASNSPQIPDFAELSSGEIKQENSPQFQILSSTTTSEQCQRSGSRGKKMPGSFKGQTIKGNAEQQNGVESKWVRKTPSGILSVDVSQISAVSPQNGHTSPSLCGNSEFKMASSGNREPTSQLFGAQYQDNGVFNNHFNGVNNSPGCHVGYNVSVSETVVTCQDLTPKTSNAGFAIPLSQLNTQVTTSTLPTILNEATNSPRESRRHGSSRGSRSSKGKKTATSSKSEAKQQLLALNTKPNSEFFQNFLSGQSFPSAINGNNLNDFPTMFITDIDSFNCNGIPIEIISDGEFPTLIPDQMGDEQLSPDSGVGEQSLSPPYSWHNSLTNSM